MKRCWLLVVMLLLALASCDSRNTMKKPEVFFDEPQMIDVMTDAYLIEAQLNVMKGQGQDVSQLQVLYYDQLFEHYGINDSVFEQNVQYYTYHPDILERVMDSVTNRFAMMQN
ncbi:MAG: DUF4296 domain-containing protein [Bacteroidales bacterium]|nr:DUF4296 domain-containing protein [Bacteroidales bacterium]